MVLIYYIMPRVPANPLPAERARSEPAMVVPAPYPAQISSLSNSIQVEGPGGAIVLRPPVKRI